MALRHKDDIAVGDRHGLVQLQIIGIDPLDAETVRRIEANGLPMLAIPENYYDDLETRFDLAPGLIADLRAHNVLYDRDGAGEYFQIYTRTFADRFFFEIVERRAYDGFGAVNAPIRLAAQTRNAAARTAGDFG